MPASRPRVIVTRKIPESVERELAADFDALLNRDDRPLGELELRRALHEFDGMLCTVTDRLGRAVLEAEPLRCRILANFGVGYNHIDLVLARRRGIVVTNTPGVLTETTADLALALLLMVARRAGEGEREVRSGRWKTWGPTHMMGAEVQGRTLGIIGLGRIGSAVARRAHAGFGMRVLSYTPNPVSLQKATALGVEQRPTIESVLADADFVSIHCPAKPETHHLINAGRLARMKPTAFLINTARGDIVDEAALVEALQQKRIAGAGLDVYEQEPRVPEALLAMENVVLLPHLGSATLETRTAMGMRAVENLRAFFHTGKALDPVVPQPSP
jgi:lactate dehydrogenase-like 2-hydroxyacid dehydrogenase